MAHAVSCWPLTMEAMLGLWWTQWHWDRFLSYFLFSLFHHGFPYPCIIWGINSWWPQFRDIVSPHRHEEQHMTLIPLIGARILSLISRSALYRLCSPLPIDFETLIGFCPELSVLHMHNAAAGWQFVMQREMEL